MRAALALIAVLVAVPCRAQEAGWHYAPFPGEGDRAALGCSYGASPAQYTCLAVRCEDDLSVGLYIHTSRGAADAGAWVLEFDKEGERHAVMASPSSAPYHARVEGDVTPILEQLRNAGLVYLDPQDGPPIDRAISLAGSLAAINRALYYCAPRAPAQPDM
ncbi:MAG: hypothetical protein IPK28_01390 [Devosia sp.]|nr:hypothetical protein [Devosia sp.]